MRDDRVYLDHILECIRRIEEDVPALKDKIAEIIGGLG